MLKQCMLVQNKPKKIRKKKRKRRKRRKKQKKRKQMILKKQKLKRKKTRKKIRKNQSNLNPHLKKKPKNQLQVIGKKFKLFWNIFIKFFFIIFLKAFKAVDYAEFRKTHEINVDLSAADDIPPICSFEECISRFPATEELVSSFCEGFKQPTPIQSQCWPISLSGR